MDVCVDVSIGWETRGVTEGGGDFKFFWERGTDLQIGVGVRWSACGSAGKKIFGRGWARP